MQTVKKISISLGIDTLAKLKEAHKESGYRSFSEFLEKAMFLPYLNVTITMEKPLLTQEQADEIAWKRMVL